MHWQQPPTPEDSRTDCTVCRASSVRFPHQSDQLRNWHSAEVDQLHRPLSPFPGSPADRKRPDRTSGRNSCYGLGRSVPVRSLALSCTKCCSREKKTDEIAAAESC